MSAADPLKLEPWQQEWVDSMVAGRSIRSIAVPARRGGRMAVVREVERRLADNPTPKASSDTMKEAGR